MTALYHGSLDIVAIPEIREPNRTLDYGEGFYLTSSAEQAEAWVRRKLKGNITLGYVNIYEYDEEMEAVFETLAFEKPDEAWLDFVMANRMNPKFKHSYDIVRGPVANDRVYASFALYEAGLIDKRELIIELRAYKLVNQILIHTDRALTCVKWKEAKEIRK
ncbi:MAG: DUF3990 domain-containing protein [Muribaculaceae bacterium]|nr:DUF3990 domain-containing protein [Muribaculaceae bacterium]